MCKMINLDNFKLENQIKWNTLFIELDNTQIDDLCIISLFFFTKISCISIEGINIESYFWGGCAVTCESHISRSCQSHFFYIIDLYYFFIYLQYLD